MFAEVLAGVEHRFAHLDVGRHVHHHVRRGALHCLAHRSGITRIRFHERSARINRRPVTGLKAIEYYHFMTAIQQYLGHNAADIARASGYKDFHSIILQ